MLNTQFSLPTYYIIVNRKIYYLLEGVEMADRGFDGFSGFFGRDTVLWFIILFLLLFGGCGCGFGVDPK